MYRVFCTVISPVGRIVFIRDSFGSFVKMKPNPNLRNYASRSDLIFLQPLSFLNSQKEKKRKHSYGLIDKGKLVQVCVEMEKDAGETCTDLDQHRLYRYKLKKQEGRFIQIHSELVMRVVLVLCSV